MRGETDDPQLRGWVASVQAPAGDIPRPNLSFGRVRAVTEAPGRIGLALGDREPACSVALSAPLPEQAICLHELPQGGRQPLMLYNGKRRSFLQDGAVITLKAACAKPGAARVSWVSCGGLVRPAR